MTLPRIPHKQLDATLMRRDAEETVTARKTYAVNPRSLDTPSMATDIITAGYVADIYTSRARAYRSAAQEIPSDTWTKLVCDVESYDVDDEYNTTTGEFTSADGGVYAVTAVCTYEPDIVGFRQCAIYKNAYVDTAGAQTAAVMGGSPPCVNAVAAVSSILVLSPADVISVYTYQDSGTALNTMGGSANTTAIIQRIATILV